MTTRYIPVQPGQRVRRCLGPADRPRWWQRLWPTRRRAVPSYATPEQCRTAHPGCEVWSVNVREKRKP